MISHGRIALNGKTLDTPATVLTSLDGVTVDGMPVEPPQAARLFRYHKSAGLLTAERDFTGRMTIYDRMPEGLPRVMPVGRLDLNTEGLLLLTNDGELKRQLELPSVGVERTYRARAYGQISQEQLEDLMLGVEIEGVRYGPINANIERRTGANVWIEMTLTEGKNREVRRVLEYLGLEVSRLIRTRYGPFWLGDLPIGDVDEIRQNDLATFRTVLSKPGGGKAASNLQFAVRQRVPAAPKPQPVQAGGREPDSQRTRAKPPPRARPVSPRPEPVEPRFPPRGAPPRAERAATESRFTPRVTPGRTERPARPERPARDEKIANPARAARSRAHRDTLEPRAPRPGTDRPTKGPAGGRGKPPRPGKPARPPRTRK